MINDVIIMSPLICRLSVSIAADRGGAMVRDDPFLRRIVGNN